MRTAQVCGDPQAVGGRTQLCLDGEEQAIVEELRTKAQHQSAVHPLGFLGCSAQEIVSRLLGGVGGLKTATICTRAEPESLVKQP